MKKKRRHATKIMLMRHAEKPPKDGTPFGVTFKGDRSKESLRIRGWQRAGALVSLLAPADRHQHKALAKPHFLFASKPLRRKGSRRPIETITPLAERLELKIDSSFERSQCESMVKAVFACRGVVLICWQREYIPEIATYILGSKKAAPSNWPEDRFDMIWVFDLDRSSNQYRFKQVPQNLLADDVLAPIKWK